MFARAAESDATIKAALEGAILYKIDCEKGEGIEIAKRYGVRGYPTFKMVNSEGAEIERWLGYEGPENWAAMVDAGVADQRTLIAKKEAYTQEATVALARSLANAAATEYDFKSAVEYFRKAREMDPANADDYTDDIVTSMYYGARGEQFTLDDLEAEAKTVLASGSLESKLNVTYIVTRLAEGSGQPERATPYLTQAMAESEGSTDERVVDLRGELAVDHALLVEMDKNKAFALKKAGMKEGWEEDASQLNRVAWWCFQNDVALEEAEELALKGIELAESDGQRADILDTAAEICNARGNCEVAIARIKQAIELDPEKAYLKDQLAKFEAALAEKQG